MLDDDYKEITNDIQSGNIDNVDPDKLTEYLARLCKHSGPTNASHIISGITINHASMKQHINKLDKQNRCTQKWFMVFAAITLLASLTQIHYARKADTREAQTLQHNKEIQQIPEIKSEAPSQVQHPSSYQSQTKSALTNVSSPNPTLNQTTNGGVKSDKVVKKKLEK